MRLAVIPRGEQRGSKEPGLPEKGQAIICSIKIPALVPESYFAAEINRIVAADPEIQGALEAYLFAVITFAVRFFSFLFWYAKTM